MERNIEIEKRLEEAMSKKKKQDKVKPIRNKHKLREEIKNELKSFWFWFYFGGMVLFATILNIKLDSQTIKIGSLIGLIIIQLVYNLKTSSSDKTSQRVKWILFILLGLLSVAYISALSREFVITGISLLIILGVVFISTIIAQFKNLWESKSIPKIIFEYLVFAFIIIFFFAFIYSILSAWPNNQILNNEAQNIKNIWDFVYFSSSVFYTNVIEYSPIGYSKLIVIIELAASFVIHIILLGSIIPFLKPKKDKVLKKKKKTKNEKRKMAK